VSDGPPAAPWLDEGERARILVVEEHPRLRRLLHTVLSGAQHAVDLAPSAEAALRCLAGATYDLVIVDLGSRAHGGPRLAATLRAAQPGLAVVLLTDRCPTAPQPGIDAVVGKPFSPAELRALVARTLAQPGR
jgi:two-component system, OmpR family, phosphate regulon response regulator OmpR